MRIRQRRRILRILRRVIVVSLVLLIYAARVPFIVQLKNTLQDSSVPEYQGGFIDDVQSIRCYRWFKQCRSLIGRQSIDNEIVYWSRVPKNISDDSLYAIECTLFYKTFLYVHKWDRYSKKKPISEMAISRDPSIIPLQVMQDVQKMIKDSDSSVFHNHIHRQRRSILNIFASWQSDIIYSLGEDWKYKGGGIWCKHRNDQNFITNVEIYLGSGFIESRPYWKEVIHEYSLDNGIKSLPMSITRKVGGHQSKKFDSKGSVDDVHSLHIAPSNSHRSTFKILQITDVHFRCSDDTIAVLNEFQTKHFVTNVISRERPDLVVITGDILDAERSVDYQTCIMKLVQPMIRSKIPYAIVPGVDDFSPLSTGSQIQDFIVNLPFCLNKFASSEGHMAITTHFPTGSNGVIYMLNSFEPIAPFFLKNTRYKDFEYALAFRHLPIPEYRPEGVFPIIGQYNEQSSFESNLKEEKLIQAILYSSNVKVISCGHEHSNDCCLQSHGEMWLCYGGSSGVGVDRMGGMQASVRLFNIDGELEEITSWKRNCRSIDSVYDYQYIFKKSNI